MKQLTLKSRTLSSLALSAFIGAFTISTATADLPTVTVQLAGSTEDPFTFAPAASAFGLDTASGRHQLNQARSFTSVWGNTDITIQELEYDLDPIVYNSTLIVNNDVVPLDYVVNVILPTVWPAPNSIRGSIDTSLIGTDAVVSPPLLGSIYTALIDGSPVMTLQDDPFSLSTPQGAVSSDASFGYDLNFIPVTSSIGIELTFTLSPGDTATIVSDFEVVEVIPEPATAAMLLVGGALLLWRRRR